MCMRRSARDRSVRHGTGGVRGVCGMRLDRLGFRFELGLRLGFRLFRLFRGRGRGRLLCNRVGSELHLDKGVRLLFPGSGFRSCGFSGISN